MIRGSNLSTDVGVRLDDDEVVFLPEETVSKFERSMVRPGDLVFTCWGTVGQIGLIDESCRFDRYIVSNKQMKLTPNPDIVNSRFLYYALSSPANLDQVQRQAIGSAVPGFNLGQLRQIMVRIPSLATQRIIASILGSIDDLIENNRRRIEVLEHMAQAIYQEWFVHFRFPGHEDATFVDSPLGPVPDGWRAVKTSEIINEGLLEIGDGYRAKNSELIGDESDLPFVRVANVRNGSLVLDKCDYLPLSYLGRLNGKISRAGDTVISMKGTIGRSAFVDEYTRRLAYSPQVSYWRTCDTERIAPTYLYAFIRSDAFVRQCAVVKGSTDMADYVNLKDQRDMTLVVPTTKEMVAFERSAGEMLRLAARLRNESTELSAIRDLLLPRLVTGEIDVSQLDLDAVAAAS
jgi:type I restriction enzyme S subunit